MQNLGSGMLLAGSLLFNQSVLSETLPPSPGGIDDIRTATSSQVNDIIPESSDNSVSYIGNSITLRSSSGWGDLAYIRSVQNLQATIIDKASLTMGGWKLWLTKGDSSFGVGRGIGLKYNIPTQNFISGSTGVLETGVWIRWGIFIKAKITF